MYMRVYECVSSNGVVQMLNIQYCMAHLSHSLYSGYLFSNSIKIVHFTQTVSLVSCFLLNKFLWPFAFQGVQYKWYICIMYIQNTNYKQQTLFEPIIGVIGRFSWGIHKHIEDILALRIMVIDKHVENGTHRTKCRKGLILIEVTMVNIWYNILTNSIDRQRLKIMLEGPFMDQNWWCLSSHSKFLE